MDIRCVINITGQKNKSDVRALLDSIPKPQNKSELARSDSILPVAAAHSFLTHTNPLLSKIALGVYAVGLGQYPGICIHGFPIGGFPRGPNSKPILPKWNKKRELTEEERDNYNSNPAFWSERSPQLLTAICGMLNKPLYGTNTLQGQQAFNSDKEVYEKHIKHLPKEFRERHRIFDDHQIDYGNPEHTHSLAVLIGLNSGGADVEGNDRNPTRIRQTKYELIMDEPIMRGTVMIIGDLQKHERPPAFMKTQGLQRNVMAVTCSYGEEYKEFSPVEITEYIEQNFVRGAGRGK